MSLLKPLDIFEYDREIRQNFGINYGVICGVDEAGRGPLAGDVFAAAVVLPPELVINGLDDSKKLSAKKRDYLFSAITEKALALKIASASVEEIERLNILGAALLAMRRAAAGLERDFNITPEIILVDGNVKPEFGNFDNKKTAVEAVIGGDGISASIAAASILAKVARDRYMEALDLEYPEYRFAKHKGYGTKLHYEMLDKYGISPVHRMSFLKKYLGSL